MQSIEESRTPALVNSCTSNQHSQLAPVFINPTTSMETLPNYHSRLTHLKIRDNFCIYFIAVI
jgi:hypothetical protein